MKKRRKIYVKHKKSHKPLFKTNEGCEIAELTSNHLMWYGPPIGKVVEGAPGIDIEKLLNSQNINIKDI